MIPRPFFTPEHDDFRATVRRFVEREIVPHHADWERAGFVPREIWRKAGELGMLCSSVPVEYGGAGGDWLYNVIVIEELWRVGASGPGTGFMAHSEMTCSYILAFGTEEQKRKWLPGVCSGTLIASIGITEPGAGSDVQGIATRAERDGDEYVINGQKMFITNGGQCDIVVLVAKTDPQARGRGTSLIVVETARDGFSRGSNLEKIGTHAQDTAELFFDNVRVPVGNLLGEENRGFKLVMNRLAHERITQAVRSTIVCEAAIGWTAKYTSERKAFGRTLADFQNTQFVLAQLDAETTSLRIFTDWCITRCMAAELTAVEAAKVKLMSTDLQGKVVDQCLQLFGGYGYMREFPIGRAFIDARITRIGGGAIEVMKQVIAKELYDSVTH